MTLGKKFLERVLLEGQLSEAKKDVDGFKDNFDITTLPVESPVMSGISLPMARQVIQLYHLMGVSVESLEFRPKAVKMAAMEVADEMRTNRPLRVAAQRLFAALATAKGFTRKEEMMEASASMSPEKDVQLLGSQTVKQMGAVLAALKLPASVLQRSIRRDQDSLMATAEILRTGSARTRFTMLAAELGVDLMAVGQKVNADEGFNFDDVDLLSESRSAEKRVIAKLEEAAKVPFAEFQKMYSQRTAAARSIIESVGDQLLEDADDDGLSALMELVTNIAGKGRTQLHAKQEPLSEQEEPSVYDVEAQNLLAALGVDVAKLPAGVRMKMKMVARGDRNIASEKSMIIRLMRALTERLSKQGRELGE
jgi:hypothetical protein